MKITTTLAALALIAAATSSVRADTPTTPTITPVNLGVPTPSAVTSTVNKVAISIGAPGAALPTPTVVPVNLGLPAPVLPVKLTPVKIDLGQPGSSPTKSAPAEADGIGIIRLTEEDFFTPDPVAPVTSGAGAASAGAKLPAAPLPGGASLGIAQKIDQISGQKSDALGTTPPTTTTTTKPTAPAANAGPVGLAEAQIPAGGSLAQMGQKYGLTPSQMLALRGPDGTTNAQYLEQQHPGLTRDKNWPQSYLVFPGEKLHVPGNTTVNVNATIDPIPTESAPITTMLDPVPAPTLSLPSVTPTSAPAKLPTVTVRPVAKPVALPTTLGGDE